MPLPKLFKDIFNYSEYPSDGRAVLPVSTSIHTNIYYLFGQRWVEWQKKNGMKYKSVAPYIQDIGDAYDGIYGYKNAFDDVFCLHHNCKLYLRFNAVQREAYENNRHVLYSVIYNEIGQGFDYLLFRNLFIELLKNHCKSVFI